MTFPHLPTAGAVPAHAAHATHGPAATTLAAVVAAGLAVAAVAAQLRHVGAVSRRAGRVGLAFGLAVALAGAVTLLRSLALP